MSQPTQEEELLAQQALAEAAATHASSEVTSGLSQGQIVRKRFFGHTGALIGLAVFAVIFLLAFTSVGAFGIPGWWKYNHVDVSPLVNDGAPRRRFGRSPGESTPSARTVLDAICLP
ncbi:part of a binding-protein-dependent transport system [Arthrobacter sp. Hiyo8]|nr:part of a binding-protein-dependent transport system [Arthrobacter sp. Hiyo8]